MGQVKTGECDYRLQAWGGRAGHLPLTPEQSPAEALLTPSQLEGTQKGLGEVSNLAGGP